MNIDQEIALTILAAFGVVGLLTSIGVYLMVGMAWDEFNASYRRSGESRDARPSGWSLLGRACARKCPACGRGNLFRSYFEMNAACPACAVVFWSNEGEWIGSMVIGYGVAVSGILVSWATLMFFGFSATLQMVIPAAVAIILGIGVVPWSRSFWTVFLYISGEMAGAKTKPIR
jgi:uncharacterized protein (DUF983 family)